MSLSLLGLDEYEEDDAEFINSDDYYESDPLDHDTPAIATEPLEEGLELLASGDFGRIGIKHRIQQRNPNIVKKILKQRSRAIPVHSKEDFHSVRITSLHKLKLLRKFCYAFRILFPILMELLWQIMTPGFILPRFPKVFLLFLD